VRWDKGVNGQRGKRRAGAEEEGMVRRIHLGTFIIRK